MHHIVSFLKFVMYFIYNEGHNYIMVKKSKINIFNVMTPDELNEALNLINIQCVIINDWLQ